MPDRRRWIRWAAWVWTILILLAVWTPAGQLPLDEDGPPGLLSRIPHPDKVVHATLFAIFAALWETGTGRRRTRQVILGGVLLAVVSELGQALPVLHRDAGLDDVAADLVGLLLGLGLVRIRAFARMTPLDVPSGTREACEQTIP
jgi:VanZ family protein